ncbi:hypothetical protein SAMN05880574_13913 [Chryseobacterium sp. RU37D]|nr:hypothetical protein SAMN05880574_13913 [Chryseobacterium sp. RU37D]
MLSMKNIFDSKPYKRRFKIEKANAWLDSFKALLLRFETLNITWRIYIFDFFYFVLKKN